MSRKREGYWEKEKWWVVRVMRARTPAPPPPAHWHRHREWEKQSQNLESSLNFWKNFYLHLANTAWYKNLYHCFLFLGLIFSPSFHNCTMLTIASSPNICQTMRAQDGESEAWINQPIHMVKIEFLCLVLVFLNCFTFSSFGTKGWLECGEGAWVPHTKAIYQLPKVKWNNIFQYGSLNREISSVLCDHTEGWDREGGRETQEGEDMGIYVYA